MIDATANQLIFVHLEILTIDQSNALRQSQGVLDMAGPHQHNIPVYDPVLQDVPVRKWTVLAQDPGVTGPAGHALTVQVTLPAERLERGPKGHRIHVIDYDASTDRFYRPRGNDVETDLFAGVTDIEKLVGNPHFHQQNVYAIAMATLQEFEGALGRRVAWGFEQASHQLKIAPHAFADANAYYSREAESLNFGYFTDDTGETIFTCLSHDIVAHETTHALLDGLRPFYLNPSSTDQAGFHEGLADIVALLSVFRGQAIVERALDPLVTSGDRISLARLTLAHLANTALAKLAEQMGAALNGVPSTALRESLKIRPATDLYQSARYEEEHDRGELLVAVVIRAFMETWLKRLEPLRKGNPKYLARKVVAEEGATAAAQLLTIVIRAIDYLPPVDMTYRDYLSALLTADMQLYPDDERYHYRETIKNTFAKFGIQPANSARKDGAWNPPNAGIFTLSGTHFEAMRYDPTEVARFVWENRRSLGIEPAAFTRVTSVRPVTRVSNDKMILRETVVEYVQTLKLFANELGAVGIKKPEGMPGTRLVTLYGGGTLIFNEFGLLKFHIGTGVRSPHQTGRLQSLWDRGYFTSDQTAGARIAKMHRDRILRPVPAPREAW